jgi:hypothetical protein
MTTNIRMNLTRPMIKLVSFVRDNPGMSTVRIEAELTGTEDDPEEGACYTAEVMGLIYAGHARPIATWTITPLGEEQLNDQDHGWLPGSLKAGA